MMSGFAILGGRHLSVMSPMSSTLGGRHTLSSGVLLPPDLEQWIFSKLSDHVLPNEQRTKLLVWPMVKRISFHLVSRAQEHLGGTILFYTRLATNWLNLLLSRFTTLESGLESRFSTNLRSHTRILVIWRGTLSFHRLNA